MQALIQHLIAPLVSKPDAISIKEIEEESVTLYELVVDPADVAALESDEGETLRSVRSVLSAASGRRKVTLDLVEEHSEDDADDDSAEDDEASAEE